MKYRKIIVAIVVLSPIFGGFSFKTARAENETEDLEKLGAGKNPD